MTSSSGSTRTPLPYTVLHAEYGDVDARVKSFTGWPGQVVGQDPKVLAVSGLFYIGSADRVRCFSCGTTLRNWQPHNDPLEVHLSVAPHCSFIQALTKKHPPANPAVSTSGGDAPASGQGSPRAGVKDGSASSTGGSGQVVRGSTASAISGLDRGSFGPGLRSSAAGVASGSGRGGPPPNGQTAAAGLTSGSSRIGPPPNAQISGSGRGGPPPNGQASGSGRGGPPPNGQTSEPSRVGPTPYGQTPAPGMTSTSAKASVSQVLPGSSPNAASSLSSRASTPLVQGSSASGAAGGPLGTTVRGPATRMTSGADRGPRGGAVVAPRAQTTLSTSGDLCEDCPSGPASTFSYNRGDNSRRQDPDAVASLGEELSSPAALAVVEMGVPRQTVEAVLRDRKSRGLQAPLTAVELYVACQDAMK